MPKMDESESPISISDRYVGLHLEKRIERVACERTRVDLHHI
jgi:hypothetical protein